MHSRPLIRWLKLASPLALLVACSGSDPLDEHPGAGDPGADSLSSPELSDAPTRVPTSALREADLASVAQQIPGRNLALQPPRVSSAEVIPGAGEAESRLEVTFREVLPRNLKILIDGTLAELRDDGREQDREAGDGVYTTRVPADFQRAFGGERVTAKLEDFLQGSPVQTKSGSLPDFSLSLLVTNLAVVNDSSRVSDPCVDFVTPSITTKEWSFGYMLNHMTNTAMTGVSADTFARAWLNGWMNSTTINGDPVTPPRIEAPSSGWDSPSNVSVPRYILNTWRLASRVRSDGTLDPNTNPPLKMEKAPFRLLGVAFRPDLRKNAFFGEGSAGELRFIYGVLDLDPRKTLAQNPRNAGWGSPCMPLDGPMLQDQAHRNSTVILEYAVDKATGDIIPWGQQVSNLSNLGPHSESAYRSELQRLTDSVVRASRGKAWRRANESALIRIRTNEAVTGGGPWHLREFGITAARDASGNLRYQNGKLLCSIGSTQYCVPKPQTVKQTPAGKWNGSKELSSYAFQNEQAILADTYSLPELFNTTAGQVRLLGGKAINNVGINTFWEMPLVDSEVRHKLSLNTCNGCHSRETNTPFAHVESRLWDSPALLSGFLSGYLEVADPITGEVRGFSEPDNRALDLKSLADGNIFSLMSFQPTSRTH